MASSPIVVGRPPGSIAWALAESRWLSKFASFALRTRKWWLPPLVFMAGAYVSLVAMTWDWPLH